MEVYEKALKVVDIKMTFRCSKEVVVSLIAAFIWKTKLKAKLHINQAFSCNGEVGKFKLQLLSGEKKCRLLKEIRHSCCRNKDREMTIETAYPIGALSPS